MVINIVTVNGYKNYGNRLQLFALSKTLERIAGGECMLRNYWPKSKKQVVKENIKYLPLIRSKFKKETKMFLFSKINIPKNTSSMTCDYAVVGSDQVWNPEYIKTRPFLLDVPGECEMVSYAASIGFSEFDQEWNTTFKESLVNYSAISVREQSAKELLQSLTDKKIEVVLDPTLLLDRKEYEKLEQKPKNLKEGEKYILYYVLGNREQQIVIEKYAKEHNLRIILFSDKRDSDYGVEEFLYLIHHAELICTDSFHACVFSFIFERPFVAFKRTGVSNYMYTRLQNLIETFKLKNREYNGEAITEENLEVDYTEAKKILKKEQRKSLDFLEKALDIKE